MNSERLNFNHYSEADFDDYFTLVGNAEVMKMVTGRPHLAHEAHERLTTMLKINQEFPKIGHYKVSLSLCGGFVGHCKVVMTERNEAELGYLLLPEHWGKGYGSEIAKTLVNLAKQVDEIHALIAIIDPENKASQRILEKQGFLWDYNGEYIGLPAAYYKMEI